MRIHWSKSHTESESQPEETKASPTITSFFTKRSKSGISDFMTMCVTEGLRDHQSQFRNVWFSKILWGSMPPDPPRIPCSARKYSPITTYYVRLLETLFWKSWIPHCLVSIAGDTVIYSCSVKSLYSDCHAFVWLSWWSGLGLRPIHSSLWAMTGSQKTTCNWWENISALCMSFLDLEYACVQLRWEMCLPGSYVVSAPFYAVSIHVHSQKHLRSSSHQRPTQ